MENNGANGRVLFTKFLEEWGIDTALMGPSYPYELHEGLAALPVLLGPAVQMKDGKVWIREWSSEVVVEHVPTTEFTFDWECPLVDAIDGEMDATALLTPLTRSVCQINPMQAPTAKDILFAHVARMPWETLVSIDEDLATEVYKAALAMAKQEELPWPLLEAVDAVEVEEEEAPTVDEGETGQQQAVRYWHHPESCSVFTTPMDEEFVGDGLAFEIDEETWCRLDADYQAAVAGTAEVAPPEEEEPTEETEEEEEPTEETEEEEEEEEKISMETFAICALEQSRCMPEKVLLGTEVVTTEGWTGATIAGWSEPEIRTYLGDGVMDWILKYFDWQAPQEAAEVSKEQDAFGDALRAYLQAYPETEQQTLNCCDMFAALPAAQRSQLLEILTLVE
jgi:hypothetical protein